MTISGGEISTLNYANRLGLNDTKQVIYEYTVANVGNFGYGYVIANAELT